jgi:hypothetical protein
MTGYIIERFHVSVYIDFACYTTTWINMSGVVFAFLSLLQSLFQITGNARDKFILLLSLAGKVMTRNALKWRAFFDGMLT